MSEKVGEKQAKGKKGGMRVGVGVPGCWLTFPMLVDTADARLATTARMPGSQVVRKIGRQKAPERRQTSQHSSVCKTFCVAVFVSMVVVVLLCSTHLRVNGTAANPNVWEAESDQIPSVGKIKSHSSVRKEEWRTQWVRVRAATPEKSLQEVTFTLCLHSSV